MARVRIGDVEIFFVDAGKLRLDGGSMFGSVPKPLWSQWVETDAKNRIALATRSLLIKAPKYCALIDGGVGSHWDEKFKDMFAIEATPLETALKQQAGVSPDDVTHVVVTHWHFDHVGGLVRRNADGDYTPVFKNAEVYTQLANFNVAKKPYDREKASYLQCAWAPYESTGQLIVGQLAHSLDTEELFHGVHAQRSDGHTIGQQLVHLPLGKEHLVFCADLIPTHHHLKPHFSMGFDVQPLVLEDEKKALLRQSAAKGWTLIFEHDTEMPAARVVQRDSAKGPVFDLKPCEIV